MHAYVRKFYWQLDLSNIGLQIAKYMQFSLEAGPYIDAGPRIEAGVSVYIYMQFSLTVLELKTNS